MGGGWKRVVEVIVWLIIIIIEGGCEGCLEEERSALLQLQHFFNSPLYRLVDDYSADCCLWQGVECSNTTGRVIELYLGGTRNTWESTEKWYLNASLFTPFQQLQSLYLDDNNIAGFVENEGLSGLSKLQILYLSYNYFNNSILSFLGGLSSLRQLYLFNNSLKGSIDVKEWNSLINLERLDLSDNEIDKIVVPKGLRKLKSLDLSGNNLNRSSISLIGLSSLRKLYLSAIGLKGSFEVQELDSLSNLEELDMSSNEIDDLVVPKDYKGLRKLRSLTLWSVKIRDAKKLLQSLGSFPSLNTLYLSYNNFTEPESIFQGFIPARFSNLKQIESLDLSYNLLNGRIPPQLIELNALAVFSVAYNNLSGKIPDRVAQFSTFENDSYEGNPFLCGLPLPKSCNENGLSSASTGNEEDDSLIDMDSFHITFTVSYVIVILGIIGVLWVNPYWRHRWFYLVEMWIASCYYFVVDNLIPIRFYC